MSETNEFVIKSDGLKRRRIIEDDIDVNQAIIDQIAASVARRTTNVLPMKIIDPENDWRAGLTVLPGNQAVWSLPIHKISLRTFYQSKDGVVFPVFDDQTSPKLELEWQAPKDMVLVLGVMLDRSMACLNQYLVAFDMQGRTYRLPLSNLYEDCRLCCGVYKSKPTNQIEALTAALVQLRQGEWNKDLYSADAEKRKRTRSLFSFKCEEKGFSQIPHEGDWTKYCEKVANEFLIQNIINPVLS